MKVSCVITCHKEDPSEAIWGMLTQTFENKQIIVVCSSIPDLKFLSLQEQFPQCEFLLVPNRKDWGHTKRAAGLAFAEGKYVCFVNDDDEYDPHFLEIMVGALEKENAYLAYCHWADKTLGKEIAQADLKIGGITSGSFVVRTDLAKKTGWNHRIYAADWKFIQELMKKKMKIVYLPYSLMAHN